MEADDSAAVLCTRNVRHLAIPIGSAMLEGYVSWSGGAEKRRLRSTRSISELQCCRNISPPASMLVELW